MWVNLDFLAFRKALAGRDADEMGGIGRLGEQMGASATEDMGVGIDAPAAKLVLAWEAFNACRERNAEWLRSPAQCRGHEEAETYQRGNGISRQTDHRRAVESSDTLWPARLLIHMTKPAIEHLAYYFKLPSRDSARGNDGVWVMLRNGFCQSVG